MRYSISSEYSSSVSEGKIISQKIKAGKSVDKGKEIKLKVSIGKKPQATTETHRSTSSRQTTTARYRSTSTRRKHKKSTSSKPKDNINNWHLKN